jgi:hypothetical protein
MSQEGLGVAASIRATAAASAALRFEGMSALWVFLVLAATAQPPLPAAVSDYLARHGERRLPTLRDVAPEDEERVALEKAGLFRPLARAELTGDGRPDLVVLLLVEQGGRYFEVVAFHATADGFEPEPYLVHRESVEVPVGVEARPDGRVVPLFCRDCDASLFYRWNGAGYEANLFRLGEEATLLRDPTRRVELRAAPRPEAATRATVDPCTRARIVAVGQRDPDGTRWYEVEAVGPDGARVRGHVTGETLNADPVCLAARP